MALRTQCYSISTTYFLSNFYTLSCSGRTWFFFSVMIKIMWQQKFYSMNNWRLQKPWFYLSEIKKQFMSKSFNTVRKLNINAIKTIKKVSWIQFLEVFKTTITQYTAASFKSWGDLAMWNATQSSNTDFASAHLFLVVFSIRGRFLYNDVMQQFCNDWWLIQVLLIRNTIMQFENQLKGWSAKTWKKGKKALSFVWGLQNLFNYLKPCNKKWIAYLWHL